MTTLPLSLKHRSTADGLPSSIGEVFGAGNEIRTRDPNLGKVVLYQLSYSRRIAGYCKNGSFAVKRFIHQGVEPVRRFGDTVPGRRRATARPGAEVKALVLKMNLCRSEEERPGVPEQRTRAACSPNRGLDSIRPPLLRSHRATAAGVSRRHHRPCRAQVDHHRPDGENRRQIEQYGSDPVHRERPEVVAVQHQQQSGHL